MPEQLGVGMVGYAFMGAAHSQAWRSVHRFFDVPLEPAMVAICGRNPEAVEAARRQMGWASAETDWRALVARDDVGLVDVCTPGSSHAEIAVAALAAGKHVLCEKPLANTVDEARTMVAAALAAEAKGVRSMVGFNYRRVPAVELARRLVAEGRIGPVRHVRAVYLQDWIVDPEFPLVWRLVAEEAGSGALGDIGSHIVDLAQHVLGQRITGVGGLLETFVEERPLPGASSGLSASGAASDAVSGAASGPAQRGRVTVDDAAVFAARFDGGAVGSFEATRFATGRKNALRIEVNGARGSVAFDLERLNELELLLLDDDVLTQGFRRVLVTEAGHPWFSAWWPPGHVIGWEHTFTHEVRDLLEAIGTPGPVAPTFADGLQVQLVLEAVARSAREGTWQGVPA